MMIAGLGVLAAAVPVPTAHAQPVHPAQPDAPVGPLPGPPPPQAGGLGGVLFADEFDGPPGAPPDYAKWTVALARERIRNPVFWDRPENMGEYRDDRQNVFLDGNSNLVIRATREGDRYFGGKVIGNWRGGIGTTWEARVKLECLTAGCWPAWWLLNDAPGSGGEVDLVEWYGNGEWPSGTTVHSRLDGSTLATFPMPVDAEWHVWRCRWDEAGLHFWKDPVDWAPPYFDVPAFSMPSWPFNDPGYQMFPVLNLAVAGSGGGDPSTGVYPAQMLVDYVRVW
ncbi:MAG: glycoside hydrolase family 16 protein [Actinobacteria bacterium]|nr:glycoside hydrolase family 16 protein [Actinomycetota bacterium]